MKRCSLFILLCVFALLPAAAQTVIDLKRGGKVHGKTLTDVAHPSLEQERMLRDTLEYNELLTRGFNALSLDSLEEAEKAFSKALKLRPGAPGNEIVRFNIAQIEMAQGRLQQAVRTLGEVLKANPAYHAARRLRAVVLCDLKRFKEVLSDCEALLPVAADEVKRDEVLFLRASAYLGLRQYQNARRDLELVLRLRPENVTAALLLALTYDGEGRTKEALERINLILHGNPAFLEALLARADIELRTGALLAARADLDEAIRLNPLRPETYAARAEVLFALNMKTAARHDIDRAVELGMPRSAFRHMGEKRRRN